MREIKFRAWNGVDWLNLDEWPVSELSPMEDGFPVFMQYTGLKDKNGVEIYESDLVTSYGKTYEVVFDNGCFSHLSNEVGANSGIPYKRIEAFKQYVGPWTVIGNIYENPDMKVVSYD